MRKELLLTIAAFAGACSRTQVEPLPLATTPYLEPTPTTQALLPEGISEAFQNQAGANFLGILSQLSVHEDPKISGIQEQLFSGQGSGGMEISTSIPILDEWGSPIKNEETPLVCYFDERGVFVFVVNTNFFYFPNSQTPESISARLYECLNFRVAIEEKYISYLKTNPTILLSDAIRLNPEWIKDSVLDAWYQTASDIVAPYREKMPGEDSILGSLLHAFDTCGGDEDCFKQTILKSPAYETLEI